MGFFSFITQDTGRSISNIHSSRGSFFVCMHDNKGNIWTESNYDGYGVFGEKDYYELLAEMNGLSNRSEGIYLVYSGKPYIAPNITECIDWEWREDIPQICQEQGFFYEDEELDDEWDDWENIDDLDDLDDWHDDPSRDHLKDEEYNFIQEERERERDRDD